MTRNITVEFSEIPVVKVRVINKSDSISETRSKKKYPFVLMTNLKVKVEEKAKLINFEFEIPKNYVWNGADIPKTLFFVGQSKDNNYLIASMVHDYMLEHRAYIFNEILKRSLTCFQYRKLTSLIFRQILKDEKTNVIKANCMAFAVDLFQMTVNSKIWNSLEGD